MSDSVRLVEVAGLPIRFDASDPARARAVEAAVGSLPVHRGPAALTVTVVPRPVVLARRPWDHADGDVRARWEDGDLLLAHGALSCRVTGTAAVIGGEGKVERGFRQLLPYILAHLLAGRDRFLLHAGAIERAGGVVLVLGASGSGKSTLVVGALRGGWRALSDDLVVVRGAASAQACGIAKPITGPADAVRSSGLPGRPLDGDPRGRWLVGHDPQPGWFPVVGTVVAAHHAGTRSSLEALTSTRLIEHLLLSFLSRQPARLRQFLPIAAAVTRRRGFTISQGQAESGSPRRIGELLAELPLLGPECQ